MAANKTLFDPDYRKHVGKAPSNLPYPWAIDQIDRSGDSSYDEMERCIFSDLMLLENSFYFGSHAFMAGPISVQCIGMPTMDLGTARKPMHLPAFLEDEALTFSRCRAKGVLFLEGGNDLGTAILNCTSFRKLKFILVCGSMPRLPMRRLLHRLNRDFDLPIYALTDNDTWGFFSVALLRRGLLAPHLDCKYFAVPEIRWLGLRAHDIKSNPDLNKIWKPIWNLRLRHLRSYPCFKGKAWQREFDGFKKNRSKLELAPLMNAIGAERFLNEFVIEKVRSNAWVRA